MNDLRKSFLRDFGRRIGWGAPKPWGAAPRRAGFSPHSQRLEREAAENVARGRQTRGQAQGALDRSFAQQPAETRAAPAGAAAQGFGGAGFTGGVSRKLGQAPSRAWVAPKPPPINPPMAKATSVPADTASYPPSNGDALMDDAQLRELIARETASPLGKAHFENIMDGLDAVAVAFAQPEKGVTMAVVGTSKERDGLMKVDESFDDQKDTKGPDGYSENDLEKLDPDRRALVLMKRAQRRG